MTTKLSVNNNRKLGLGINRIETFAIYSLMQSDGNSLKIYTFREANYLTLNLKTPNSPYSCLAKVIFFSDFVEVVGL